LLLASSQATIDFVGFIVIMSLDSRLEKDARTLSPLPEILSKGLIAVAFTGTLSFLTTITLFVYLIFKISKWRFKHGFEKPLNQFLVLIMHLLFADIQQGIAFMLNIKSLQYNKIEVGTPTCWAQAWFLSTGDLASSVMITAIGVHTFLGVVKGYRPPTWIFHTALGSCWVFVYLLGAIGPLKYGDTFFVRASLWVSLAGWKDSSQSPSYFVRHWRSMAMYIDNLRIMLTSGI
jgi:hypothetical protein